MQKVGCLVPGAWCQVRGARCQDFNVTMLVTYLVLRTLKKPRPLSQGFPLFVGTTRFEFRRPSRLKRDALPVLNEIKKKARQLSQGFLLFVGTTRFEFRRPSRLKRDALPVLNEIKKKAPAIKPGLSFYSSGRLDSNLGDPPASSGMRYRC